MAVDSQELVASQEGVSVAELAVQALTNVLGVLGEHPIDTFSEIVESSTEEQQIILAGLLGAVKNSLDQQNTASVSQVLGGEQTLQVIEDEATEDELSQADETPPIVSPAELKLVSDAEHTVQLKQKQSQRLARIFGKENMPHVVSLTNEKLEQLVDRTVSVYLSIEFSDRRKQRSQPRNAEILRDLLMGKAAHEIAEKYSIGEANVSVILGTILRTELPAQLEKQKLTAQQLLNDETPTFLQESGAAESHQVPSSVSEDGQPDIETPEQHQFDVTEWDRAYLRSTFDWHFDTPAKEAALVKLSAGYLESLMNDLSIFFIEDFQTDYPRELREEDVQMFFDARKGLTPTELEERFNLEYSIIERRINRIGTLAGELFYRVQQERLDRSIFVEPKITPDQRPMKNPETSVSFPEATSELANLLSVTDRSELKNLRHLFEIDTERVFTDVISNDLRESLQIVVELVVSGQGIPQEYLLTPEEGAMLQRITSNEHPVIARHAMNSEGLVHDDDDKIHLKERITAIINKLVVARRLQLEH